MNPKTSRRPPTPEEITAQQKEDAAKAKAAAQDVVPATPAGTAVAVPDNRTVPERLADQLSPSFMPGPPIKFDGKAGKFVMSGDGQAISDATRYIALIPEMWNGYIKFNGEGEQPTRVGGLPYDGYEMPLRESLGDLDPNEWPIGLNEKPSDPWLHQVLIPLQNAETKEIVTFGTTSVTGRTAVGALLRSYNRMRRSNPDEVPIIQLRASSYEHRTYGKVNIPSFVICGRTTLDGTKPDTAAADMNDDIPW
jgi:hypothetical protein